MDKDLDIPASPAARDKARRLKARKAADAWRKRAVADGRPAARDVDGAIVEAASFLISKSGEPRISIPELIEAATLCLQRDGYDRLLSFRQIANKLRARPEHNLVGVIPNFAGVDDLARVHPPRNGRVWRQRDADRLNELVGHTPNTRPQSAPPLPLQTQYEVSEDR